MIKQCTLLLLRNVRENLVLLGRKKRGFGAGKINGFGGKVEPGETLTRACCREMLEESGVTVVDSDLKYTGFLVFTFVGRENEELHVHVFSATRHSGEAVETEEMAPRWYETDRIPFSEMWGDDSHWFPYLLSERKFRGHFNFADHSVIVSHKLDEVSDDESPCPYILDPHTTVLLSQEAPPQTSIDF